MILREKMLPVHSGLKVENISKLSEHFLFSSKMHFHLNLSTLSDHILDAVNHIGAYDIFPPRGEISYAPM